MDIFAHLYSCNYDEHILDFNGITLIGAVYEPDWGCCKEVKYGDDYFISGVEQEKVDITANFRGLKGTAGYQVDLFVGDSFVKTMMVQTTPDGYIYSDKQVQFRYQNDY